MRTTIACVASVLAVAFAAATVQAAERPRVLDGVSAEKLTVQQMAKIVGTGHPNPSLTPGPAGNKGLPGNPGGTP